MRNGAPVHQAWVIATKRNDSKADPYHVKNNTDQRRPDASGAGTTQEPERTEEGCYHRSHAELDSMTGTGLSGGR
jgi:hypothetical protein